MAVTYRHNRGNGFHATVDARLAGRKTGYAKLARTKVALSGKVPEEATRAGGAKSVPCNPHNPLPPWALKHVARGSYEIFRS